MGSNTFSDSTGMTDEPRLDYVLNYVCIYYEIHMVFTCTLCSPTYDGNDDDDDDDEMIILTEEALFLCRYRMLVYVRCFDWSTCRCRRCRLTNQASAPVQHRSETLPCKGLPVLAAGFEINWFSS